MLGFKGAFVACCFLFCMAWLGVSSCRQKNADNGIYSRSIKLPFAELPANHNLKIVTYIDGTCPRCLGHLERWKEFVKKYPDVNFLFYFHTSSHNEMDTLNTRYVQMNYPLIFDSLKVYLTDNHIPEMEVMRQTYLLDSERKILLMGNPILSDKIKDMYEKVIQEKIKYSSK